MDLVETAEFFIDDFADFRVLVYGEYDLHVIELLRQCFQGFVDMAHRFAEILAAMCRHEDDALIHEINILQEFILKSEIVPHRMMQGIDDCVSRHENGFWSHMFCQQILL